MFCRGIIGVSLFVVVLSATGCSRSQYQPPVSHFSAGQEFKANAPFVPERTPLPHREVPSAQGMLLQVEGNEREEWTRKAYETVDDWWLRIRKLLYSHHNEIRKLEFRLSGLETEEQELITRIKELLTENKQMRKRMDQLEEQETDTVKAPQRRLPPAPFGVHLVRRGDTLYSISRLYFGSGDRVKDIMFWNQGWIRHPEELLAGIGIVLFDKKPDDSDAHIVDRYLAEIRALK